jgi:Transposase
MSESVGIDSISGGTMPRPYSADLRVRVIEEIATGASRRAAAERYCISASVVVIWALRKNREQCGKTEWRQHVTVGKTTRNFCRP